MNIKLALLAWLVMSVGCQRADNAREPPESSGLDTGAGGSSGDAGASRRAAPVPMCAAGSSYGTPLPPAENRAARLVVQSVHEWEGAVWVPTLAGLFFSEIDYETPIQSTIKALTPNGTLVAFIASSGSSGLAVAGDGQLLAAVYDAQTLATVDLIHRTRSDLELTYQGKHFNSPRGITVRSDGNAYFSDPSSRLADGRTELGFTGVFRISPSNEVTLVDAALHNPHGITLGLDEGALYVGSEDGNGAVTKYVIDADGSVHGGVHFVDAPHPTGLTMDCAGNLYAATEAGRVVVFDRSGAAVGEIGVGPRATDVAFGGPAQKTLFITTGVPNAALFAIDLNVPGLPN